MPTRTGTERRKNPYRSLFATPGAVAFAAAGMVSRMGHAMTILATVLLISSATGSYALAGEAATAYALSYAVASPLVGRVVDRRRQSRVLLPLTVANATSRAAFLVAAWASAPAAGLVVLSGLSGATMPSVGSLVRARWAHLLRGSPLLNVAMSIESVAGEVIFILGSVAVSTLVTFVHPAAGLIMALLLAGGGLGTLAGQRRTDPPLVRHDGRTGTPLRVPGFWPLLATFVAIGTMTGLVDLGTVAFCTEHAARAWSGWILAVLALGSGVSGWWYGTRDWRGPPQRRLALSITMVTAGALLLVAAPDVGYLLGAAFLVGLALGPTMIAGFSSVVRRVPARQLTEGLTWVSTAMGLGISLGTTPGGVAIDRWGPTAAFAIAAACVAVAALAWLSVTRRPPASVGGPAPTGQEVR